MGNFHNFQPFSFVSLLVDFFSSSFLQLCLQLSSDGGNILAYTMFRKAKFCHRVMAKRSCRLESAIISLSELPVLPTNQSSIPNVKYSMQCCETTIPAYNKCLPC